MWSLKDSLCSVLRAAQAIFAYDDHGVYILTGPRFNKSLLSPNLTLIVSVLSPNGTQLSRLDHDVGNRDFHADDALLVGHVQYPQSQIAFFIELTLVAPNEADGQAVSVDAIAMDRAVYWVATTGDELDWDRSNFYTTPVKHFADFSSLAASACDLKDLEWTAQAR